MRSRLDFGRCGHILARSLLAGVVTLVACEFASAQPATTRANLGPSDVQANGPTNIRARTAISADGRFVAFDSVADNLVAGDTNTHEDVFVRDRQTGTTTRVSVGPGGIQADERSVRPAISADGRWVAFESRASNLVAGDTNGAADVFVHDRQTGATTRVSVATGGAQWDRFSRFPSISADGRWVAFDSAPTGLLPGNPAFRADVFVHDRVLGTTTLVSMAVGGGDGDSSSFKPTISADGRVIAFESASTNLVPGDDLNGTEDVLVHDLRTGTTTRVNVGPGGVQGAGWAYTPSLSADGRFVAFTSQADNLVPGDTNAAWDVFVHDRQTSLTTRVSVGPGGVQTPFRPGSTVSVPTISADGRWVVFESDAANLVAGDTNGRDDVFVHDRQTGTTTRVGLGPADAQGNDHAWQPVISADGRFVVFESAASNLVTGDTNGVWDIFAHDRGNVGALALLAPTGDVAPVAGQTGTVVVLNVTSAWTAVSNDPDWISITAGESGAGVGIVSYTVAANTGPSRTGTITIAGRTFTVTQAPPVCSYSIDPGSVSLGAADSIGQAALSAPGGCAWTAVSSEPTWLAVTAGARGAGNGLLTFYAARNPSPASRTATLTIAGQTLTVMQAGYAGATSRVATGLSALADPKFPVISADGRWVALESNSTDLVPGDTNGFEDIFLHDRQAGTTTRVNVASDGTQANSQSVQPAISADGRFVAFASSASNLVAGDTNGVLDVFVHDRQNGTTTRASVGQAGAQLSADSQLPSISADGRWVTFRGAALPNDFMGNVYVHDRLTGTTEPVSVGAGNVLGNNGSLASAISADGRWVAFESSASNLVPGDTNDDWDIFVRDRQMGTTRRVSVGPGGAQVSGDSRLPAISADGRVVTFQSAGTGFVDGDTNNVSDIFAHDLQTSTTTRVSLGSGGVEANLGSSSAAISAEGRWVAFSSAAFNLLPLDTNLVSDVFVHDRQTQTTTRASLGPGGVPGNGHSVTPGISADGRSVVFDSSATNLGGDANGPGVFVHDQHGPTCSFTLVPDSVAAPQAGLSGSVMVLGREGCSWTAASSDPGWLTLTAGTDGAGFGTVSFVAASNASGANRSGTLTIAGRTFVVLQSSVPPPTAVPDVYTTSIDQPLTVETPGVLGNDAAMGGGPMQAILSSAPGHGRVALQADGALTYTPDAGFGGVDSFTYRAQTTAGVGNAAEVTIRVGLPPAALADSYSTPFGTALLSPVSVLANDNTNGGGAMTAVLVTGTASGSLSLAGNGVFTYTPNAGFTGVDTFTYRAVNLAGPGNVASVTIAVGLPPPTTAPDSYTTAFNTALSVAAPGVLANDDSRGAGSMTASLVTQPGNGAVVLDASGAFTYTPNPAFTGRDEFVYRAVTAAGAGPTAVVSITVLSATTPLPPTGLRVHSIVGNSVTVRWTIQTGGPAPTNFVLEGGVNAGEVLASLSTASTTPTFTFSAPTGSFHIRVHAVSGSIRSTASNEIRIHVNVPEPPSAPANLIGLVNGSTLALAWTNTYGGAVPAALELNVTGAIAATLPLGLGEAFAFVGVPSGTYTLALRARNAGGTSPPSNAVTLTLPGTCSGAPMAPVDVLAYRIGRTVYADWKPASTGPAPTGFVVNVTGSFTGSFSTTTRALSGTVGPGSYSLSVVATNACGDSAATLAPTITVP
jgi:Tol biopolymer transport system component